MHQLSNRNAERVRRFQVRALALPVAGMASGPLPVTGQSGGVIEFFLGVEAARHEQVARLLARDLHLRGEIAFRERGLEGALASLDSMTCIALRAGQLNVVRGR
jgi:hypothetical protein